MIPGVRVEITDTCYHDWILKLMLPWKKNWASFYMRKPGNSLIILILPFRFFSLDSSHILIFITKITAKSSRIIPKSFPNPCGAGHKGMAKNPGPGAYDHEPPELPICQRLPGGEGWKYVKMAGNDWKKFGNLGENGWTWMNMMPEIGFYIWFYGEFIGCSWILVLANWLWSELHSGKLGFKMIYMM